ncbi:MAG: anion permease [Firmicutes bacterium]|nr:anion permease [Bacillota bacterium]MBQ3930993.1 anion permease [Bacillota bacterium]
MTTQMIIAAILVIATIVLFITEVLPLSIGGILGMLLLVIFKILPFNDAFSSIASSTVGICFGMMIVSSAMFESGLVDKIGQAAVKLAKGSEKALLWILVWLCFILAAFLSNTTVVVLGFTLAAGVVKASPNIKLRNIAMPIAFATCFGGQCTLIGTTSNLVGSGLLEAATGQGFKMFTTLPIGLLVGVPTCLLMCILGPKIGNKIWGDRPEESFIVKEGKPATDKKKMIIMAIIMIALIVVWVTELLDLATGALLGACIVIILGIVDFKTAFHDVNWNICIWLGIILALPKAITSSGLHKWLADNVLSVVDMAGKPMLAFAFFIVFTFILTHLISNSTCVGIVLPIAITLCQASGVNPLPFAVGITVISALAIATPLGAGFVAYVAMAGYGFKDFLRYGWLFAVVSCVLVIVGTPLFFPF